MSSNTPIFDRVLERFVFKDAPVTYVLDEEATRKAFDEGVHMALNKAADIVLKSGTPTKRTEKILDALAEVRESLNG